MNLRITILLFILSITSIAQHHMRTRRHTINQTTSALNLLKANRTPSYANQITFEIQNEKRIIKTNSVPTHLIGEFPNNHNPNSMAQIYKTYSLPLAPKLNSKNKTSLSMRMNFGISIEGVPFDPGAAEWYLGNRNSLWQYEPLAGAIELGVDENNAHIQPNGQYHYHGLPQLLINSLVDKTKIIGWAADGFPIYHAYKNDKNSIITPSSSYKLKSGRRPSSNNSPGGFYDGTFIGDYEYSSAKSELGKCNEKFIKTKEFPGGTYAYFLTKEWPVVPRCFIGSPDQSFAKSMNRRNGTGSGNPRFHHPKPHHRRW